MSVDRSIEIEVFTENKGLVDCLRLLFNKNWTPFNTNREIEYIALGVTDILNLTTTKDLEVFYKVIREKERNKELCVVHFWDMNYEEALTLFIYPEKANERYNHFKLLFSLGASKRLKGSQRQTDFSYYLEKIIPVLESNKFLFESITCIDFG